MIKFDSRTVCNRVALHGWSALNAAGVGEAEFVRATGIAVDQFDDPHGRINAERHRRFVQFCRQFPLARQIVDVGPEAWFLDYPALANLCFNSATLRTALGHLLQFRGLIGEFDFMLMAERDGRVEIEYLAEFTPDGGPQAFANFKTLALVARCYDQGAVTRFQVGLQGAAPPFAAAVSEFFGATVRYGQARNTLLFEAPHLDLPFAQLNRMLAPHALQQAHSELQRIRGGHRFSAKVELALRAVLAERHGRADSASLMALLCERLDTNQWTLRRHLQQDQTSFRLLEARVKSLESRRLLEQSDLSLAEIGDRLGFSSQSAFTRFFTSRHALPPARYRLDARGNSAQLITG